METLEMRETGKQLELTSEEALLFAKFLRHERKERIPRIGIIG
jgi:hypothetical protein